MNRPVPPLSTLQKSYDDAHLVCSTAIYFESRANESEALRCWRNALDQLNYHKLYRIPGAWRASNETEKELVAALLGLERQARERINLLEALEASRKDSSLVADGVGLGAGTVKPLAIDQLAGPPPLPNRPMPPRVLSSQTMHNARSRDQSRSPSPDKKSKMKSTLRSNGKTAKSSSGTSSVKRQGPQGASKAATLAWTTTNGSPVLVQASGAHKAAYTVHPRLRAARVRSVSPPQSRDSSTAVVEQARSHDTKYDDPAGYVTSHHESTLERTSGLGNTNPRTERKPAHRIALNQRELSFDASRKDSRALHIRGGRNVVGGSSDSDSQQRATGAPITSNSASAGHVSRRPVQQPRVPSSGTQQLLRPLSQDMKALEMEGSVTDTESDDEEVSEEESWFETSARILNNLPRGVDHHAAEQILNEVIIQGDEVHWSDIAGLEIAKAALKENVVYPFLRPDLFRGLREPARGILLFGPPGTGKTMLARAVATESKSTFFAVSASSLTSKFLGESEKLVRALFSLAKLMAPSVIFVDEIDSLLSSRSDQGEHETSRRIKTEFLIQWSDLARAAAGRDAKVGDAGRVLVLAATNAPWSIDDAARRRFVRRQYIPLPEGPVRATQIYTLLAEQKHNLSKADVERLIEKTQDFSGSDITALAKDAAMGPLRSLGDKLLLTKPDEIRPISYSDFESSLQTIRPSVNKAGLQQFDDWAKEFGERGG